MMVARRKRKTMVTLKIIKPCQKYCHLFQFFILNIKVVFCDAFAGYNLRKVYLTIPFSVFYFAVR